MKPFYEEKGITIYHGDARELASKIPCHTVITDPIWPDCEHIFPGVDAASLLHDVLADCAIAERVAIHLGCYSDPRFLKAVPLFMKFFRVVTLDVARVGYRGRLLMTGDIAYLFGEPPASRPGAHVIPGRMVDSDSSGKQSDHPCPRKLNHVGWLVRWWSEPTDIILDPFMGSGTSLVAAKNWNRRAVGIEIEEAFCEIASNRLRQSVLNFEPESESCMQLQNESLRLRND
jgi:hypothetical protein